MSYIGRFAPSPSGPLHAGSLIAALASWLDARAQSGRWLLRIEDIDAPRCDPQHSRRIMDCLLALGLHWDGPVWLQTERQDRYQAILDGLHQKGLVFPCACSRKDLAGHFGAFGELCYPGNCRSGLPAGRKARSWRLRVNADTIEFQDRLLGWQRQHPAAECGDFVLRRADKLFAYQLVVVVDDADQAVNQVVRGEDLLSSTGRQILLQQALQLPQPKYLHIPVLKNAQGQKLSKQNGALEIAWQERPEECLNQALKCLGQAPQAGKPEQILQAAVSAWDITKIPIATNPFKEFA